MIDYLESIYNKKERLVIGLMSGTSMDGVDAALARIRGHGLKTLVELASFISLPYEAAVLDRLENVVSADSAGEISELNFLVGESFANAALEVVSGSGFRSSQVDLIGSHGQTVYHNPPSRKKGIPSTLQLGELDVIAERTGITTVGDFRTRDIAAGGEGAPLIAYVDYLLYKEEPGIILAQNIGGIANVTVVTQSLDDVVAFDTGPGNMLMDKVVGLDSDGRVKFDKDGRLAGNGEISEGLLQKLLSHPYFTDSPPKSTGAELFGTEMARELYLEVEKERISLNDLMATLLEFTAESVALSYERFIYPEWEVGEVVISGGGVRNPLLLERLRSRLKPVKITTSDERGIPAEAKEAVAFAVLANELISGNAGNIPSVTGAKRRVPLGKIVLP